MYPNQELSQLAERKRALRVAIALRRSACALAASRATKPIAWLDRALAFSQQAAPFLGALALPLALFSAGKTVRKSGLLGSLVKWGPLVLQATRAASFAFAAKSSRVPAPSGIRDLRPSQRASVLSAQG